MKWSCTLFALFLGIWFIWFYCKLYYSHFHYQLLRYSWFLYADLCSESLLTLSVLIICSFNFWIYWYKFIYVCRAFGDGLFLIPTFWGFFIFGFYFSCCILKGRVSILLFFSQKYKLGLVNFLLHFYFLVY